MRARVKRESGKFATLSEIDDYIRWREKMSNPAVREAENRRRAESKRRARAAKARTTL